MKKKIISATFAFAMGLLLIGFSNTSVVSAATYSTTNGNKGFSSKWERTDYFDGSSKLVYGYNTFLINEDYSHSNKKYSQAYLTNANGTHRANAALNTTWSKIEVPHAGTSIVYGVIY